MFAINKKSIRHYGAISGKVSIIITNYKKELFLKKAILSCLKQSYKNIEIIVMDDCSDLKRSLNITKSMGSDKIRYFHTTRNYGHYACCNYAMDRATGKYITFLGADDTIAADHIKNLLTGLTKHRLAGICSLYTRYDKGGKKIGRSGRLCEASILFEKNRFIQDIGYFHMVRCAADSEYRMRAIAYYGVSKIGLLDSDSYKALYLSDSLTREKNTKGGSPGRTNYVKQFLENLKTSKPNNLHFDYKASLLKLSLLKEVRVDNFDPKTFREIIL